jgi:hypothetical protein
MATLRCAIDGTNPAGGIRLKNASQQSEESTHSASVRGLPSIEVSEGMERALLLVVASG